MGNKGLSCFCVIRGKGRGCLCCVPPESGRDKPVSWRTDCPICFDKKVFMNPMPCCNTQVCEQCMVRSTAQSRCPFCRRKLRISKSWCCGYSWKRMYDN